MTLEDLLALNELELIKLQSVKTDDEAQDPKMESAKI